MEQRPVLKSMQDALEALKSKHQLLEKKELLTGRIVATLSRKDILTIKEDMELVDFKLELIELKPKIASLENVIKEREEYMAKYLEEYEGRRKEMEQNYDSTLAKFLQKAKTNPEIEKLNKSIKWHVADLEENKVLIYERIKKMV